MVKIGGVAGPALAAVVAGKDDEGVVGDAVRFEFGEDHADAVIHALEHGFVDGAGSGEHVFLGDHGCPGRVRRLEGGVDGEVGDIEKEGLFAPAAVLADEAGGALVDEVGEVTLHLHGLESVPQGVGAVEVGVAVKVGVAEQLAEVFVKAAVEGVVLVLVAEVPFAEGAGGVAGGLEALCDGGLAGGQAEAVNVGLGHPFSADFAPLLDLVAEGELDAGALLPAPGHETDAGGGADGGVGVEVGELHALGGEAVYVRGADVFGAGAAEVAVAHVIHEDEDDVRRSCVKGGSGKHGEEEGGAEVFHLRRAYSIRRGCGKRGVGAFFRGQ